MSVHTAVEGLKRLGLSNYEAQVFVALQRLGTGTAHDVSETSEVPRSQVYGAADDLAERGLVEIVETSPKTYRPVSLATARRQLREQMDREEARAFESLERLRADEPARTSDDGVTTVRGRYAINERVAELIATATERVMLIAWSDDLLDEDIEAALVERAESGVAVMLFTLDDAVAGRLADTPVRTIVAPDAPTEEFTGRTLLVDEASVLLSVRTDDADDGVAETALWTVESSIGRILAQFIHAGMLYGVNDEDGWLDVSDPVEF